MEPLLRRTVEYELTAPGKGADNRTESPAPPNSELLDSLEWQRGCDYVGGYGTDDRHGLWAGGNEFGRHGVAQSIGDVEVREQKERRRERYDVGSLLKEPCRQLGGVDTSEVSLNSLLG